MFKLLNWTSYIETPLQTTERDEIMNDKRWTSGGGEDDNRREMKT